MWYAMGLEGVGAGGWLSLWSLFTLKIDKICLVVKEPEVNLEY